MFFVCGSIGEKHTNWAGGYRVAAFISGGVIPQRLRGTTSNLRLHVVDWYPTFCAAAGLTAAQCSDDSPRAPLPIDPSNPAKDIYSNGAWPGLDGVDVSVLLASLLWRLLTPHACVADARNFRCGRCC